jgi:hypothetical protein
MTVAEATVATMVCFAVAGRKEGRRRPAQCSLGSVAAMMVLTACWLKPL